MVGITLFSVVLGLVSGIVIASLKASTGTRDRLANLDQVRAGMDSMTKSLRTAVRPEQLNPSCTTVCDYAFETAGDSEVAFLANLGAIDAAGKPAPTRVSYTVAADPDDSRNLTAIVTEMRQEVLPTWTSGNYVFTPPCTVGVGGSGCTAREITKGIRWPFPVADGPPFVYYDGSHTELSTTPTLTAAKRATISAVDITMPVGDAEHPSPGVMSSVFLPNSTLGR